MSEPLQRTGLPVDLNRGVRMQQHPKGYFVCMYKDDPGIFYAEDGTPASDTVAEEAGFPVKALQREREKRRQIEEAKRAIDAQFAAELEKIETEPPPAPAAAAAESTGGWQIRRLGTGKNARYEVVDATGSVLETDLSEQEARALVDAGQAA